MTEPRFEVPSMVATQADIEALAEKMAGEIDRLRKAIAPPAPAVVVIDESARVADAPTLKIAGAFPGTVERRSNGHRCDCSCRICKCIDKSARKTLPASPKDKPEAVTPTVDGKRRRSKPRKGAILKYRLTTPVTKRMRKRLQGLADREGVSAAILTRKALRMLFSRMEA